MKYFLALLILLQFYSASAQEPLNHVTGLTAEVLSDSSIRLTWIAASGTPAPTAYLVIAVENGQTEKAVADNALVADDEDFSAGNNFDGALNVIGTDTTFTTLNPAIQYDFKVYSYTTGGTPNDPDYKTDGVVPAVSATTFASPPTTQPSSLTIDAAGAFNLDLTLTDDGDGASTIIIMREGAAVNVFPDNGNDYAVSNDLGSGNIIVYNATNTGGTPAFTVEGLNASTTYHFAALSYNGSGVTTNYLVTTPFTVNGATVALATAPSTQVSGLGTADNGMTSLTLTWTAGDGANTIIVANTDNVFESDPQNGFSYTADQNFGSGSEVSTGDYVVYIGNLETINVNNLMAGGNYYFQAYTFNGSGRTENYLTASPATASGTTPAANTSTLAIGSTSSTISSIADTEGEAVTVFDFTIDDIDTDDGAGMEITEIIIRQDAANNDVSDWTQAIAGAKLVSGGQSWGTADGNTTIGGDSIRFANIPISGGLGSIAVDGQKNFELKIWLKSDLSGTENYNRNIDGKDMVFTLDANADITISSGSTFAANQSIATSDNTNVVDVTATQINVSQQPSTTAIRNEPPAQQPKFEARDANNNLDIGFAHTATIVTSDPNNIDPDGNGNTIPADFSGGIMDYTINNGQNLEWDAVGSSTMSITANSITSEKTNSITVIQRVQVTQRTSNLGTPPLGSGTKDVVVLALKIREDQDDATTVLTGFTITDSISTPVGKFENPRLYRSDNSSFNISNDVLVSATIDIVNGDYVFTNMNESILAADANSYFFFVVDVTDAVSTSTEHVTLRSNPADFVFTGPAGSASSKWNSPEWEFEDVSTPAVDALVPIDTAKAVPITADLVLTFTEAVNRDNNTGTFVYLYKDGVVNEIEKYEAKTNTTNLSLNANKTELTINPTANLDPDSDYYITIDAGAFLDNQNNDFPGIDNSTVYWRFRTYGAPVISTMDTQSCIGNEITITGRNFSKYPGNVNGITSVDFCSNPLDPGTCTTQNTVTFLSDTQIKVAVPANAPSGKIILKKAQHVTGIGTNAASETTSNDALTLGVPFSSFEGDTIVCTNENGLLYYVDLNGSEADGFTYTWNFSNTHFDVKFDSDVNIILLNAKDQSTASTEISVVKSRGDGCDSQPLVFDVEIKESPDVLPVFGDRYPNTKDTVLLELKFTNDDPALQTDSTDLYFYANNGVTNNGTEYFFHPNDFNPNDFVTVNYEFTDQYSCSTIDAVQIEIYDGKSLIQEFAPDFCESDLPTANFSWPVDTVITNIRIYKGIKQNPDSLINQLNWSQYGFIQNGSYIVTKNFNNYSIPYIYFDPNIAFGKITHPRYNAYTIAWSFSGDGLIFLEAEATTYLHPNPPTAEFNFPFEEKDGIGYNRLEICNATPNGVDLNKGVPIKFKRTESNPIYYSNYSSSYLNESGIPDLVSHIDGIFDPLAFIINKNAPTKINVEHQISIDYGNATCSTLGYDSIIMYPQPAKPEIKFLNSTFAGLDTTFVTDVNFICAVGSDIKTAYIDSVFWDSPLTSVTWSEQNDGSSPFLPNSKSYTPLSTDLKAGSVGNNFYVQQIYKNLCPSPVKKLSYEYFPNLNDKISRSVLNDSISFEAEISDNDYLGGGILIGVDEYTLSIKSLSNYAFDSLGLNSTTASPANFEQEVDGVGVPVGPARFKIDSLALKSGLYEVILFAQTTNNCLNADTLHSMFFEHIIPEQFSKEPGRLTSDFTANRNAWFAVDRQDELKDNNKFVGSTVWKYFDESAELRFDPDQVVFDSLWGWSTNAAKDSVIDENSNVSYFYYLPDHKKSYLYSPSYDLSIYERPMVAINAASHLANSTEGIALQYTYDTIITENTVWKTIGKENSGLNWYNASGIASNPGDQSTGQYGWGNFTTPYDEIKNTYFLELKNQLGYDPLAKSVIFRLALHTLDINEGLEQDSIEGFAIRKFDIGNRTRTVLVENFGNLYGNATIGEENGELYDFTNSKEKLGETQIVLINYRTPFPSTEDPFYKLQSGGNGARTNFYNIKDLPSTRIDGLARENYGTLPWSNWGESFYGERSLKLTNLDMDLSVAQNGNGIDFGLKLKAKDNIKEGAILHRALVFKKLPVDKTMPFTSGEDTVRNALKEFLPDAAGYKIPAINVGDSLSVNYHYTSNNLDLSNLTFIAFVQSTTDELQNDIPQVVGEIIQAYAFDLDTVTHSVITNVDDSIFKNEISIYPNPNTGTFNLLLPDNSPADRMLRLFDNFGRLVWEGQMNYGERSKLIQTEGLGNGVYHLQIIDNDGNNVMKRLMIMR